MPRNKNKRPAQQTEQQRPVREQTGSSSQERRSEGKYGRSNCKQDYKWYHISDAITKAVGNVPFNVFPGTEEDVPNTGVLTGISSPVYTIYDVFNRATPGILRLDWDLIPGCSYSGSSAVNVAARALYTYVRHQNSGHSNYESSDLMLFILAMDEIYTEYFEAMRDYAIIMRYSVENRNVPDGLAQALDIDANDFRQNLAQYRAELNLIGAKISSMAVPNVFSIFLRHTFLASKIFIDSETRKAQFYAFKKRGYRVFAPSKYSTGGCLQYYQHVGPMTTAKRIQALNSMINQVLSDEDMNIMSGDILKAFGRENLYTLPALSENTTVEFVYNEDVLEQIHNSFAIHDIDYMDMSMPISGVSTSIGHDIAQSDNVIYCGYRNIINTSEPESVEEASVVAGQMYFNSFKDEVTPQDVIEWSRLLPACTVDSASGEIRFRFGSEVITGYHVFSYSFTAAGVRGWNNYAFKSVINIDSAGAIDANFLSTISKLSQFDWFPILYIGFSDSSASPKFCSVYDKMGDLKQYTLVSSSVRERLNDTAVMGELGSLILEKFTSVNK